MNVWNRFHWNVFKMEWRESEWKRVKLFTHHPLCFKGCMSFGSVTLFTFYLHFNYFFWLAYKRIGVVLYGSGMWLCPFASPTAHTVVKYLL